MLTWYLYQLSFEPHLLGSRTFLVCQFFLCFLKMSLITKAHTNHTILNYNCVEIIYRNNSYSQLLTFFSFFSVQLAYIDLLIRISGEAKVVQKMEMVFITVVFIVFIKQMAISEENSGGKNHYIVLLRYMRCAQELFQLNLSNSRHSIFWYLQFKLSYYKS